MIINKFYTKDIPENYIDIYYKIFDDEVSAVLNLFSKKIIGRTPEFKEIIITPSDVYYFEMVDRKCFAYLQSGVFSVELSLQSIIGLYSDVGFIRISKSMIVNAYRLAQIKSDMNMRINAVLENGEIVIVNRSYRREFYKSIGKLLRKDGIRENNR